MANIQSFINEISPTSTEITQISTSWAEIRKAIEGKLDFISSSMLTWSYIRNTKISPIDDLDIFFMVNAWNTQIEWKGILEFKECKIYIQDGFYNTHPLKDYTVFQNNKYYISPNKIMNQMKKKIEERYTTTSSIERNGECITTYLSSYNLTIDSVPYIWVTNEEYLLIPTSWNDLYRKKTNPVLDKTRIDNQNDSSHFNWKMKWVVKLMKYWNEKKNTGVSFRSYVIECIIYQALKDKTMLYSSTYVGIIKTVISDLYSQTSLKVLDIPGYNYIEYSLTDEQRKKIKWLLETLWNKLQESEENFITYLKS